VRGTQTEGDDGPACGHGLDDLLGALGLGHPHRPVDGSGATQEPAQRERLEGCGDHGGDGEAPVEGPEADEREGDGQGRRGEGREHPGDRVAHSLDVSGDPRDHVAAASRLDPGDGQGERRVEHVFAQVGERALAELREHHPSDHAQGGRRETSREEPGSDGEEDRRLRPVDHLVDEHTEQRRGRQAADRGEQQHGRGGRETPAALPQQLPRRRAGLTGRRDGQRDVGCRCGRCGGFGRGGGCGGRGR